MNSSPIVRFKVFNHDMKNPVQIFHRNYYREPSSYFLFGFTWWYKQLDMFEVDWVRQCPVNKYQHKELREIDAELSIHIYRTSDMCAMLILKHNDHKEAMSIAWTVLRGFCRVLPGDTNVSRLNEPQTAEAMKTRYQRAEASLADRHRILTIHTDVKAAKQYLEDTIGSLLGRGEAIEDLVLKSDNLSQQSKEFYVTVGKMQSKRRKGADDS